jgi:hypothetical protein
MKRPLTVTAIGGLFIVTGIASVIYHATEGPVNCWTLWAMMGQSGWRLPLISAWLKAPASSRVRKR